jgi:L-ascorbate metabolism protein UlaG (beta-lactamase superfamily)
VSKRPVRERSEGLYRPEREGLHHVGNATHWIVFQGVSILTDPWVMEPAHHSLSHRIAPVPLPTSPDVVLITHAHEDHFDPVALGRLNKKATVVVPQGPLVDAVGRLGFAAVAPLCAGATKNVLGLAVEAVSGRHDVPEVCYRVSKGESAFFFGGDTMLTPQIEALAQAKPTPFVILPGERSSLLGRAYVMMPEEAIQLAERFRARQAVLTHHETYISNLFPIGWLMHVPPPDPKDFPEWFAVPAPGDFVPFPWSTP